MSPPWALAGSAPLLQRRRLFGATGDLPDFIHEASTFYKSKGYFYGWFVFLFGFKVRFEWLVSKYVFVFLFSLNRHLWIRTFRCCSTLEDFQDRCCKLVVENSSQRQRERRLQIGCVVVDAKTPRFLEPMKWAIAAGPRPCSLILSSIVYMNFDFDLIAWSMFLERTWTNQPTKCAFCWMKCHCLKQVQSMNSGFKLQILIIWSNNFHFLKTELSHVTVPEPHAVTWQAIQRSTVSVDPLIMFQKGW